ncbi:MAG: PepSY domain-containing protein [Acetobacteraceae bacterium]
MTPRFRSLTLAAALAFGATAGVLAITPAAHAEEGCPTAASGTPMSPAAMRKALAAEGFATVRGLHRVGACYAARAIDKAGHRGELMVDAATAKVLINARGAN